MSSSSASTGPVLFRSVREEGLSQLNWPIVSFMIGIHLLAGLVFWPATFSWSGLVLMLVLFWVTTGLGIGLCFHRLLTHRSYRVPRWLEYLLTICGCLALQGRPTEWVGMHRLHHKHSDTEHDPHSPQHGFTWAHMLWILYRHVGGVSGRDAAKDLLRDPVMRWIDRLFWLPQVLLAGGLFAAGWAIGGWTLGLSWVVWGVALRTVLVFHATWFVNSASHTWGYQNYPHTGEHSTNLWWVAIFSFGEGWHNNHHAHPRSAAHGLRWFEPDPTWWTIRLLQFLGLARDVKTPDPEDLPEER
ncbi:MAG: acyl-CoA desaturase [Phycisphaeraceae bacterium]